MVHTGVLVHEDHLRLVDHLLLAAEAEKSLVKQTSVTKCMVLEAAAIGLLSSALANSLG